jgi:hypothetical protein
VRHGQRWYHHVELDYTNLTRQELLKSDVKRINGGGKTMDDKTIITSSSTLVQLYVHRRLLLSSWGLGLELGWQGGGGWRPRQQCRTARHDLWEGSRTSDSSQGSLSVLTGATTGHRLLFLCVYLLWMGKGIGWWQSDGHVCRDGIT